MDRDKVWLNIIQDAKLLDEQAENEEYVPIMTDALVMTANQLYTDDTNGVLKQQDKADLWSLIDKLGNYSVKGQTIRYLPEYQELKELIKKVFQRRH